MSVEKKHATVFFGGNWWEHRKGQRCAFSVDEGGGSFSIDEEIDDIHGGNSEEYSAGRLGSQGCWALCGCQRGRRWTGGKSAGAITQPLSGIYILYILYIIYYILYIVSIFNQLVRTNTDWIKIRFPNFSHTPEIQCNFDGRWIWTNGSRMGGALWYFHCSLSWDTRIKNLVCIRYNRTGWNVEVWPDCQQFVINLHG